MSDVRSDFFNGKFCERHIRDRLRLECPTVNRANKGETLYNGIVGLDTLLNAAVTGLANYNNAAFASSINTVMQSIQNLSKDVTATDSSIAPRLKPVK